MNEPTDAQIVVVGGGAAGIMAARWAAARQNSNGLTPSVSLLESGKRCGVKIVASGGGRCNILPSESEPGDFHTADSSMNVVKRLFRTWRLEDQKSWFEQELQLPLRLEDSGKLFPECDSGKTVRDKMIEDAQSQGVEVIQEFKVDSIKKRESGFTLTSSSGQSINAERVILATGGQSVPASGSDGHGYSIARTLGHQVPQVYPALVPLTSKDQEFQSLAGVSLPVRWRASVNGKAQEERVRELLFTHRGFSGPAILDASHWVVREQATVTLSWEDGTADEWEKHFNAKARRELAKAITEFLPRRLAEVLLNKAGIRPEMRVGNLSRGQRATLIQLLTAFTLPITGNEGWKVAEVTGGGVPLKEVNPSTLESRVCPNLFLCGEILDCTGRLGGFNFQWAWTTGRLAGESSVS